MRIGNFSRNDFYPTEDGHESIARWYCRYFGIGLCDKKSDEIIQVRE